MKNSKSMVGPAITFLLGALFCLLALYGMGWQKAQGQPTRNLYFDPITHVITEDTLTNPVCLERGHVWKRSYVKPTKACQPYIVDNLYYTIKVYPACETVRYTCLRCGVKKPSTETDRVDTIWRSPKIGRKFAGLPDSAFLEAGKKEVEEMKKLTKERK